MQASVHTKKEVIERLQRAGEELRELGVDKIGMFGSFVRNQQLEHSDVDFIVDFISEKKSFDNFMLLIVRLEEILQRRVEVVTRESLSPHIGPHILEETEYVPIGV